MKNNPASYEEIYNAFKYLSEKLHEFDEVLSKEEKTSMGPNEEVGSDLDYQEHSLLVVPGASLKFPESRRCRALTPCFHFSHRPSIFGSPGRIEVFPRT